MRQAIAQGQGLNTPVVVNSGIASGSFVDGGNPGEISYDSSGNKYVWDGTSWVQTVTAGAAHVTLSIPGELETRTFTFDAAGDGFTDKTAPIAAELLTAEGFGSGKKHCRLTWVMQAIPYVQSATSDVPVVAQVVATINAGDDTTALSRLTYVDVGAGGTASTDTRQRFISQTQPVIEWDLSGTDADIDRVDIGGYLPTDVGAIPVYVSVEVW